MTNLRRIAVLEKVARYMPAPVPAFKDRMPTPPAAKLVNSPGAVPAAGAAKPVAQSQVVAKANFAKAPKPAAAAALPKPQKGPTATA